MTRAEAGLALGVVLAFGAILIPVAVIVSRRHADDGQASRLREIYLSWSLYQADDSGRIPPNLLGTRRYLGDDRLFIDPKDPWRTVPGPFPLDGALPQAQERSPIRISDAYIVDFIRDGRLKANLNDPRTTLIADPWTGESSVHGKASFDATVEGPILRATMDGSVRRKERGSRRLDDANDLFLKPAETS